MNIILYNDYLSYLHDYFKKNKGLRGLHSQISQSTGIHPSYLSRVLHGTIHLTPDQAAGFCEYWNFNQDETQYFLNLVNFARAGTPALKRILEKELQLIRLRFDELGNRLPAEKIIPQNESIYYSSWYFSAIHILITIPNYQTESAIAEKLNLPRTQVKRILEILKDLDLIQKNQGRWISKKSNIHLSNDSWISSINHTNWRLKMAEQIQFRNSSNLHYTACTP